MNAQKMREVLGSHEDFQSVKTIVEELVESRSHICFFFLDSTVNLMPLSNAGAMQKSRVESMLMVK